MRLYLNLLRFPASFRFHHAALGVRRRVLIGPLTGFILLPRGDLSRVGDAFGELLPPRLRGVEGLVQLSEGNAPSYSERIRWGGYFTYHRDNPDGTAIASVGHAVLAVPASQQSKDLSRREVGELAIEHMPAWSARLTTWIELLTHDDLDAAHPLYDALFPSHWTTAGWYSPEDPEPREYINPTMVLLGGDRKHAMSPDAWASALRATSAQIVPPEVHLLLRDARAARLRNRTRRCIIDLATVVELVVEECLSAELRLAASVPVQEWLLSQEWRVSRRLMLMKKLGLWIPPELLSHLIPLRNRVVHSNAEVTREDAAMATSTVAAFVHRYRPLTWP